MYVSATNLAPWLHSCSFATVSWISSELVLEGLSAECTGISMKYFNAVQPLLCAQCRWSGGLEARSKILARLEGRSGSMRKELAITKYQRFARAT